MKHKVIKFGKQTYRVKALEIKSISFESEEDNTAIYIRYIGLKYPDFALKIPNENGKIDTKFLSDCYIEMMKLNREILKEKRAK